ncbi:MAG: SCP2 sterol-binding domain-containing protein [Candidatus Lokiarchaeota archaeon]|nr:SCP2 sterol-binding domain-containing protein [Candidatus Lokiarchaeota archaeon]
MTYLEDIPALIYTMLYTHNKDGRLRKATEHKKLSILFDFPDFPPAALLKIQNGNYEVLSVENPEGISADAIIKGNFEDIVELSGGFGRGISLLLTGKVKIKGLLKAITLLKILGEKEVL